MKSKTRKVKAFAVIDDGGGKLLDWDNRLIICSDRETAKGFAYSQIDRVVPVTITYSVPREK